MNNDIAIRIKSVIDHFGLTVSSFADSIGVQRSSISHILSGRNKPSLDFVMKVVKTYPDVNLYWLLIGKGKFPAPSEKDASPTQLTSEIGNESPTKTSGKTNSDPVRMVVFYADGTFESFDAKKN
ncbi:helix-turn-helix transcriptional regulator [Flagellimonas algicola]|uniref:helix-turn-helix transcriptional regulator n=1 Tax=Flagellimonas algicola TaxID=2583815 RepID=UPI001F34EE25|nr:helix-turn-helix transcriptional regulator [Allomuricauda algicola]